VAEFIGVKSFKARGKRLTNRVVDNIQELEPVMKHETTVPGEHTEEEEPENIHRTDNKQGKPLNSTQMKLEL